MAVMRDATRLFARLGGLVRRGLGSAKADGGRRPAGEALILRDEAGLHFCLPIDAVSTATVAGDTAATLERDFAVDAPPLTVHSAVLGPLKLLGVRDHALILKSSAGHYLAITQGLLRNARVAREDAADLVRQLGSVKQPVRLDAGPLGKLDFLGSVRPSYVPDSQDAPPPPASSFPDGQQRPPAEAHRELAEARTAFFEKGWCTLSGAAFGHQFGRLAGEAEGLVQPAINEYEIASEANLSIRIKRYATTGPTLEAVHHDPVVVSALRAISGALIVPTQAAYYFYRGDDYISVHTDATHCPVTVLVRVYGDPWPLMIYPALRGCRAEELQTLADREDQQLATGEPMAFPRDGAIVFEGCELPHRRPPGSPGSGFIGVAQLCYRPVWTQTKTRKMVATRPLRSAVTGS